MFFLTKLFMNEESRRACCVPTIHERIGESLPGKGELLSGAYFTERCVLLIT